MVNFTFAFVLSIKPRLRLSQFFRRLLRIRPGPPKGLPKNRWGLMVPNCLLVRVPQTSSSHQSNSVKAPKKDPY